MSHAGEIPAAVKTAAKAPKEQPPRKLSGKRTAWSEEGWKEGDPRIAPPTE